MAILASTYQAETATLVDSISTQAPGLVKLLSTISLLAHTFPNGTLHLQDDLDHTS